MIDTVSIIPPVHPLTTECTSYILTQKLDFVKSHSVFLDKIPGGSK